jgi:hypothetical protein
VLNCCQQWPVRTSNQQTVLDVSFRKIPKQRDWVFDSDHSFFCSYVCAPNILIRIASPRHIVPRNHSLIRAIDFVPEHIIWRFRKHHTMFQNPRFLRDSIVRTSAVCTQIASSIPSFLAILFVFDCLMRLSVVTIAFQNPAITEMKK